MATDLYVVLGADATASAEEIKTAYERRARELQPHSYGTEATPFRELQSAYAVLNHPKRREAYDRRSVPRRRSVLQSPSQTEAEPLRAPDPGQEPIGGKTSESPGMEFSVDEPLGAFHPSFDELFDRLWSNFALLTRPKAERLESLTVEIALTAEEARKGGHARILIPARARCSVCNGRGSIGLYECWHCQGHGAITADYPLELGYPTGLAGDYVVRVPLHRFGIDNFYLTVCFRPTGEPV